MKLLIEGYKYEKNDRTPDSVLYNALKGLVNDIELDSNNPVSVSYVGYFYSKACSDVVFCLPKVILTGGKDDDGADDTVFGLSPQKLVDFERLTNEDIVGSDVVKPDVIKTFLSELAIWIYRTISVYHANYADSSIVRTEQYNASSSGKKSKFHTLFDIIIALRDFNRENQNYFSFIARNKHSGNNKIQWTKTISKSQAIVQDDAPVYLNPVNKKKEIDFDEELLVIYFSILKYIRKTYGFRLNIDLNYELIEGSKFESYRNGKGKRRLKAIKYKYFSDKDLRMWNLCYAFFDVTHDIAINMARQDFMLVDDFQIVFERVIDDLLGDKVFAKDAKYQKDGKNIDHLYKGPSLLAKSEELQTYYIADSKYYKRKEKATTENQESESYTALHGASIPKQFTYARNLIQWNLDLFMKKETDKSEIKLRSDELTEGYNVVPNFFISAFISQNKGEKFNFKDDGVQPQSQIDFSRQFENRLFDRDTLLLYHYDVNFLFVVSLYGRDNKSAQNAWKTKVREMFRKRVQETLDKLYDFYVLTPTRADAHKFVKEHFHQFNGKLFRPNPESNRLILALMKDKADEFLKTINNSSVNTESDNSAEICKSLRDYFDGTDTTVELKNNQLADVYDKAEENRVAQSGSVVDDDYVVLIKDVKSSDVKTNESSIFVRVKMGDIKMMNSIPQYLNAKFLHDSKTLFELKGESKIVDYGVLVDENLYGQELLKGFRSTSDSYDMFFQFEIGESSELKLNIPDFEEYVEVKQVKEMKG